MTKADWERERSKRLVASGANRQRMLERSARKRGMTLAAYSEWRAEQKQATLKRKEVTEQQYERFEQRAKRDDCSAEEKRKKESRRMSDYIMRRYYSEPEFRAHMIDKARRSSAIKRGGRATELVNTEEVWKRDGKRCHICGDAVAKKDWSLDHAIAHRSCNSSRGSGRKPAQLLAFGDPVL